MLALELAASAATLAQIHLYGRKTIAGPIMGLIATALFWAYTAAAPAWGLAPLHAAATCLHVVNLRRWIREARDA